MEDFLYDFKDFISARLQEPLFDTENSTEYKKQLNNYKLYYNTLKNKIKREDRELLEKLIKEKQKIEDFYIDISYRTGFSDGINMKGSIKKENKQ